MIELQERMAVPIRGKEPEHVPLGGVKVAALRSHQTAPEEAGNMVRTLTLQTSPQPRILEESRLTASFRNFGINE